ncbi:hypothetical protein PsorP6_013355 [Peronosclerospora sorghi]|uniref:Uncharacterized protein n=1 Tax=Peronosclerospora sorghi TaxID=230839 RepID=A0ACC0WI60_9STRA|nr:hypothetical protein PsorP6_013355 [Peronosclerospora sorghi]
MPAHGTKASLNETDASIGTNHSALSFKAQVKSAVALVKERRIDFVRAKNVRIMGPVVGRASDSTVPPKETTELTTVAAVERVLVWHVSKKIGPGFANLGNTCYLNAVLQCLSYTPCFAQYLLDADVRASFHRGHKSPNGFCSVRAMSQLLQAVHGHHAVRVLQPRDVVMNVRHISKRFRIGRQEDSHEFFRLLLDSMQQACLRHARIESERDAVAATTFVHRIFGGKLKNSLKCAHCGFVSERFDAFLDLSLEISRGVHSVNGALRHFTARERLDERNAWKCSKCGVPSCAEKGLTIAECPNVLMIQLKRFDLTLGKIQRHVEFPCSLDIAAGMSPNAPDCRRGRTKYELHAVVVHAGFSTDCGHYYAFVKGSSGQWYEMNDDSVRWVSIDTVLQQKAYMLFYSRVLPVASKSLQSREASDSIQTKDSVHPPVSKRETLGVATVARPLLAKTKDLDMNGFLASLKTSLTNHVEDHQDPLNGESGKKTEITFSVSCGKPSMSTSTFVTPEDVQTSVSTPCFSGHIGRLYRLTSLRAWKSCPRLFMTRSVRELPVKEPARDPDVASGPKPAGRSVPPVETFSATRVSFDPRPLQRVGVQSAMLFGQEVEKWSGETDVESSETTSSHDGTSSNALDTVLAAKHDRVLKALKQEDWKYRNARRQDYWDEALDVGKVKKVKKRKEFVPNEGRQNVFQTTFMRKKSAKRHRRV